MNEALIQCAYFYASLPPAEVTDLIQPVEASSFGKLASKARYFVAANPDRFRKGSKILACIGAALVIFYTTPQIVQAIVPVQNDWVLKEQDLAFDQNTARLKNLTYQPAFDSALPLGALLTIPKIGVKTTLNEASFSNHEDALRVGVWRVDDFGTPDKRNEPMILVAHRFGYLSWDNSYRHYNSFYNLPKLTNGDLVEVVWQQRKYTYEIYAESEGDKILDYSADLILYTCEDLNSSQKIFRYARLLTI